MKFGFIRHFYLIHMGKSDMKFFFNENTSLILFGHDIHGMLNICLHLKFQFSDLDLLSI